MKGQKSNFYIYLFISLLILNFIYSGPSINTSINVDDIVDTQKCYDNKEQKSSSSDGSEKMTIYELNNNSTSYTIFIQYKSVKKFVISESLKDDESILYKESFDSGTYYLNMNSAKSHYYIILENDSKNHKICFSSFPEKGNEFAQNSNNTNIKLASYEILTSSKLFYFINNADLKQNNIFYGIRFDEKYIDKINKPKIEVDITFTNSERKNEKFEIGELYLQNNYYYALFFVPKLKYNEKFTHILFSLNIEFKKELTDEETFIFNLELIDSHELTCEFNLDIVSNKDNLFISPKIYYINLQKHIYQYDRDILFLNKDADNTYIKPFFTSYFNISNENSVLIEKNFIDITQSFLQLEAYSKISKIDLFILILDEKCNKISEDDNYFISFHFYGGYHSLIHYKENITPSKLFNNEKNKIVIRMEHCRTQYFINYFDSENKNDTIILDIESAIGDMNLYYSHKIKGTSLDDYFKRINKLPINDFKNSILSGKYEYGTLIANCPNLDSVMSYIYAHKKNAVEDILTFINQKSLILIEFNNQYTFQFNTDDNTNEFDFRIKVLRTNIKDSYKIEMTYGTESLSLENENDIQILKHAKDSSSKLTIKISSSASSTELENKGVILEIFKSIDTSEKDIVYIDKEVEKDKLDSDKVILFIYDKDEVNSAKSKIELYNDNQESKNISLCVHSGKGKYPFIIKPICQDDEEYTTIHPNENLSLSYNNPYINENIDDENNLFYVSIFVDKSISYSYKYEREINIDENEYTSLNHKGNKIFKLSKKINQKKSMYYQINLCGNKYQNSNLYYIFNNSDSIPIKNDIYQEFSLDTIKSYFIQFNSENSNQNAIFKYFYGPANLIKTINNFSKQIYLSKNSEDNQLLIKFESPFTDMVEITIIFVVDCSDKYDDICSLLKFCENYNKNTYNNTKIIEKRIIVTDSMENIIEICVEKSEISDFLNKNLDIYVLSKSTGSNLELSYDVKSLVIDWAELSKGSDNDQQKDISKNVICINCGLYGEQKLDNENSNNNENNNVNGNNENNNGNGNSNENSNEYSNNNQTNNENSNGDQNSNNNLQNNNDNNNNQNSNNNRQDNRYNNNRIKFNFGPMNENNEDNNDNNRNNDNNNNSNNDQNNDNNNNDQNNNNNDNNNNDQNNDNKNNNNNNQNNNNYNNNNNDQNNNNINNNSEINNNNNYNNNNNGQNDNNNYNNNNNGQNNNNNNYNNAQNNNNNYNNNQNNNYNNNYQNNNYNNNNNDQNNNLNNNNNNNDINSRDYNNTNQNPENINNENVNNHQVYNGKRNNENNENNENINNNPINVLRNDNRNMNDTLDPTNMTDPNNLGNLTNNTLLNKDKDNSQINEKGVPKKKKKSKLFLYILLIIIIGGLVYYIRNKYYNDGVNYSKISKYSYYDF